MSTAMLARPRGLDVPLIATWFFRVLFQRGFGNYDSTL
jgi:hypothetical protein